MTNSKGGTWAAGAMEEAPLMAEGRTADMALALSAYAVLPGSRLDKVLEIRRLIAAGRYCPSAEELAEAMLDYVRR